MDTDGQDFEYVVLLTLVFGLTAGLLTGMLGIGGGVIIVPALSLVLVYRRGDRDFDLHDVVYLNVSHRRALESRPCRLHIRVDIGDRREGVSKGSG